MRSGNPWQWAAAGRMLRRVTKAMQSETVLSDSGAQALADPEIAWP